MKTVHLSEVMSGKKVHVRYFGVRQPMITYHSTEELMQNEKNKIIIHNILDLQNFTMKYYKNNKGWIDVQDHNVWIATGEKVIPDTLNIYGDVLYKVNGDGSSLITDNCYIHLSVIYIAPCLFLCLTSSGIFKADFQTWNFTAATKPQFIKISSQHENHVRRMTYEDKLTHILESSKIRLPFVRVFHLMFNPLSDTFLNEEKSIKAVFGVQIKAKDRKKVFASKKFQQIMLKELNSLMPSLKDALQQTITPEKLATLMWEFTSETVKNKETSVDDKIKTLNFVGEKVYPDVFCGENGKDNLDFEGRLVPENTAPIEIGVRKKSPEKLQLGAEKEQIIPDEDLFDEFDDATLDSIGSETGEIREYSEESERKL